MGTPEEQEECLEHGRFHENPDGTPLRSGVPRWLRIGCLSLVLGSASLILIVIGLRLLGRHFTETILSDQRTRGQFIYGFSVESYRWNDEGFRVRFRTAERFGDARLDFPALVVDKVKQSSWLAGDRALLLGIEYEHLGDSLHNTDEMWILYDFGRGDLRACGLERVWAFGLPTREAQRASCDELRASAANLK